MTIKAVLFDAAGTLIHPQPTVGAAYAAAGRRHGVSLDEATLAARFRRAFQRSEELDRSLGYRTDQAHELSRWRQIVAEAFTESRDSAPIFADLWQHFADARHWRLYDDVLQAWSQLAAADYVLGVASNFDQRLIPIMQQLRLPCADERLFLSAAIGWRKPHPEFFAAVERTLALAPQEILLMGDDMENDYLAAHAAGWQTLLLDRGGTTSTSDTIHSLAELPTRLLRHAS